jgi:integrase
MSRFPFRTQAARFLEENRHEFAKSTYVERERRLRQMAEYIEGLRASGKISTADPAKMTEEDIAEIYEFMQNKDISPKGLSNEISAFESLCLLCGNKCIDEVIKPLPENYSKTKRREAISNEVFEMIISEGLKKDDFRNIRNYAIVAAAMCAGLRTTEMQEALRKNIDLSRGEIYVGSKGRGYKESRTVPIDPDGIELLRKYLEIRDAASESIFLFPGSGSDPMRANAMRGCKDVVAGEIDHKFTLQGCRYAYGRRLIRDGVPSDAVRLHMGYQIKERTKVRQYEEDTLASTKQIRQEKRTEVRAE